MSTAEIGPWPAQHEALGDEAETDNLALLVSPWSATGAARRGLGRAAAQSAGFTGPVPLNDAHLAVAALTDQAAFAAIYDRYADRLHDFCLGMLRDRDGAADCVQDTFCTAATRLSQLREPERLRPWLYAIARNEAMRRLRGRKREQPSDELPDGPSGDPGPDVLAARSELAVLVVQAAGGLSERDRALLELHYRHGLDGPELADALGVSHSNANTMVGRLRTTIERSLGALLLARQARRRSGHCRELETVLERWDGEFTVLWRKRIARHVDACATCESARRDLVNPRALLGAAPVLIPAPDWLRTQALAHSTPHLGGVSGGAAASAGGVAGSAAWWPAAASPALSALHVALVAPLLAAGSVAALVLGTSGADTTSSSTEAASAPAGAGLAPGAGVTGGGGGAAAPAAPPHPRFSFDMPTTRLGPPPIAPPPIAPPNPGSPASAPPGRPGAVAPPAVPAAPPPNGTPAAPVVPRGPRVPRLINPSVAPGLTAPDPADPRSAPDVPPQTLATPTPPPAAN